MSGDAWRYSHLVAKVSAIDNTLLRFFTDAETLISDAASRQFVAAAMDGIRPRHSLAKVDKKLLAQTAFGWAATAKSVSKLG